MKLHLDYILLNYQTAAAFDDGPLERKNRKSKNYAAVFPTAHPPN